MSTNLSLKIGLFMFLLGNIGCSFLPPHIHNAEQESIAITMQQELTTYADNAPAMYQAMLTNLEKFKTEEEKTISDLAANRDDAILNVSPRWTADKFTKRIGKVDGRISSLESTLQLRITNYLQEKKIAEGNWGTTKEAVAKARKAVLETQQSVTNWNAAVALLTRDIAEIPSLVEKLASESMEKGLDSLIEKLKDVGNKEVMFVDVKGKEITKK